MVLWLWFTYNRLAPTIIDALEKFQKQTIVNCLAANKETCLTKPETYLSIYLLRELWVTYNGLAPAIHSVLEKIQKFGFIIEHLPSLFLRKAYHLLCLHSNFLICSYFTNRPAPAIINHNLQCSGPAPRVSRALGLGVACIYSTTWS